MVRPALAGHAPRGALHKRIIKGSRDYPEYRDGKHRFEHWYVDEQVYFITARCREKYPAFEIPEARAIFWNRFDHYSKEFGYELAVTTLMNNHYHSIGFLHAGTNLEKFIQRLHGSVAKLVNDLLPERRQNFWRDMKGREYFDGCIRDEKQCRAAYRHTLLQAVRGRLVKEWSTYPDTHALIDLEKFVEFAKNRNGFLSHVPYKRYQR